MWVRQLGGRRGTSCFPPRVGGGGRGAPPGVISQARGATSSSVGRPSFLRLLSYGVGRAARHAPPPRLRGWRSVHRLRCLSSSMHVFFINLTRESLCLAREGGKGISRVRRAAKRCLWRAAACTVAALAACARVCGAVTHCSHRPSRVCWLAAVCGRLQSVLPLIVQCWALLGKCGLCVAKRACTMGEA